MAQGKDEGRRGAGSKDLKWREQGTRLPGDGDDVGLPASESDPARIVPENEKGRPGRGGPGTIPPPD